MVVIDLYSSYANALYGVKIFPALIVGDFQFSTLYMVKILGLLAIILTEVLTSVLILSAIRKLNAVGIGGSAKVVSNNLPNSSNSSGEKKDDKKEDALENKQRKPSVTTAGILYVFT